MNNQTQQTTAQPQQAMHPLTIAVTQALGYTENGGKPDLSNPSAGKTGETKSVFQFEPATWKAYSSQVFGQDNVPENADTETKVVMGKVSDWLHKGYTPEQIASMWNAGPGEPNAYTGKFSNGQSSSGVNAKYGVAYSVPQYVDKFMKYFNKFQGQGKLATNTSETAPENNQSQQNTQEDPQRAAAIAGIAAIDKNVKARAKSQSPKQITQQNQSAPEIQQKPSQGLVGLAFAGKKNKHKTNNQYNGPNK